MQSQFPSEWRSVACEKIVVDPKADIVDGPFGSNLKASEYTDSGEPIARIQNVKRFKFIDKNIRFITSTKAEELKRHSFIGGDILITKLGDPLGLACEVPNSFDSGIIVADLVRLRANTSVCSKKFIIYLLNSPVVIAQLEKHIKGSTRPRINLGIIRGLELPLPPLAEQEEIAHRLETMLAQVEATQARLARIPDIIKQFRQSVLAAAVSGKLTKEWIGISTSKRTYLTLNDVGIEVKTGPFGSALHKSDYLTGGIPIINPMHISEGKITPSLNMSISKEKFEKLAAWQLRKNDVIIGRRGEMGRAAVVNTDGHLLCGTGSMILRVTDNALPKYLEIILRSPVAIDYFNSSSVGSTMVNLNQKIIKNLKVYFPEIEEQTEIVRRVEKLFAYADTLEQQAKAAKARVDKLTQAILAKAFRGELTADWRAANPDLISGDNSAAALLARIQAEWANAKPRKRASKPAISPTSSGVTQ